ncbi:MAG: HIT family protein [Alphaproteobacteria bacterium]|nr:HIT family protein [Alphaproteobacteria bacterium]
MSVHYDNQNIFAKILRGESPCIKVDENEKALAFMDIMPRTNGHVLVISKASARNILDITSSDLADVMEMVQRISCAQMKSLSAEGIIVQQFNESKAGQVVFHFHVHVMPVFTGIALRPHQEDCAERSVLEDFARRMRMFISEK